jgi:NAD(P)H-dependent flavin oxidoreductase YrpB (nitropropane dioxygenase family)
LTLAAALSAATAYRAGVDAVVAQGFEAGGAASSTLTARTTCSGPWR